LEPGHYTDPLEEALSQASQRIAQFASLTGAMAQVIIQRKALHDARQAAGNDERATRILNEQERLIHQQAKLGWAPAHDPQWLAHADLLQAGRAWASAASHADTDPAAASAMRKCEDRLRVLHPYAMARYDRLRGDGMSPLDAMREIVPLFGRSPKVRVGDPAPARPALDVSTGQVVNLPTDHAPAGQTDPEPDPDIGERAAQRGRQIIERLQAGARAAGRPDLGPDELAMVLEAVTNLPEDVIERLARHATAEARARTDEPGTVAAGHTPVASTDTAVDLAATAGADGHAASPAAGRSVAHLAAESFPHSAADAIRTASTTRTRSPASTAARVHAPDKAKRPGPSM
jgi:hypothetical protein